MYIIWVRVRVSLMRACACFDSGLLLLCVTETDSETGHSMHRVPSDYDFPPPAPQKVIPSTVATTIAATKDKTGYVHSLQYAVKFIYYSYGNTK